MIFIAYALAFAMGFILGLIGAGGSILTMPILVYMLDVKPVAATGYSLLMVGLAAFMGAIRYGRQGLVDIKAAFIFALPAMTAMFVTRGYVVPHLPNPIFVYEGMVISKDIFIMVMFACLMVVAAIFMLKPSPSIDPEKASAPRDYFKLIFGSAGVGALTGIVGAGGGFLIVPALMALFSLSIQQAVATSLAVIAANSLIGFSGDRFAGVALDWRLVGWFLGLTLLGMWSGVSAGKYVDGIKLKRAFGVFVLIAGIIILVDEFFRL